MQKFKADDLTVGSPDIGRPSAKYSEWTVILMKAHDDLGINPTAGVYPNVEYAQKYFERQRLSNGMLISPRSAEKLASFCRPVSGMKGGNKKSRNKKNSA